MTGWRSAKWHQPITLEGYLHAYLEGTGIADDPKEALFRTIGRETGKLTTPLPQANAYAMIQRLTAAAWIGTRVGYEALAWHAPSE